MSVPDAPALNFGASAFSVEAWIRTTASGVVVAKDPGSEQSCTGAFGDLPPTYELLPTGWAISVNGSGLVQADVAGRQTRTECGFVTAETTAYGPVTVPVNDGDWHQVVVSFTPSSISIWVDGSKETTNEGGTVSSAGSPLDVGGGLGEGYPGLTGDIDEVSIYNYALSDDQVISHSEAALPDGDFVNDPQGDPLTDPQGNPAGDIGDPNPSEAPPDSTELWDDAPDIADPPADPTNVDRSAVVGYALQWWGLTLHGSDNYNPAYAHFRNDCTNFVSQALHAGGWGFISQIPGSTWYNPGQWWYHGRFDYSYTWAVTDGLWRFGINMAGPRRGEYTKYWKQLRLGDVVYFDWHGKQYPTQPQYPTHAGIVTKIDTDQSGAYAVYIASHTNNRKFYSVGVIKKRFPNSITWRYHIYNRY